RDTLQHASGDPEALARVVAETREAEPMMRPPSEEDRSDPAEHAPTACFLAREPPQQPIEHERAFVTHQPAPLVRHRRSEDLRWNDFRDVPQSRFWNGRERFGHARNVRRKESE